MVKYNEEHLRRQQRFERNLIHIPYIVFAILILILNIIYPDINVMMVLFGLFFLYNGGLLFIAFIKHFKRTTVLTLILFLLSAGVFGALLYLYATANNLF